jgi:hypothetical protein
MTPLRTHTALADALRLAIDLEVSVMLQYLYAAYSLPGHGSGQEYVRRGLWTAGELLAICGDGEEARNQGWRGTLLEVAHEEMIHFVVANNLLRAIGEDFHAGAPRFGEPGCQLAGVELSLERFNADALARFIALEQPMSEATGAVPSDDHAPASISALYAAIRDAFVRMPELIVAHKGSPGGEHHLFLNEGVNWHHPDYQLQVDDLPSALFGIDFVVAQGEGGARALPRSGVPHLERFQRIAQDYRAFRDRRGDATWTPAYPALKNPTLRGGVPGRQRLPDPSARALAEVANGCYELMLLLMLRHFVQPPSSLRRSRLMNASIDVMTGLLRPLAIASMVTPSGVGGSTAGPSFEVAQPLAVGGSLAHFCRETADRCRRLARQAHALGPRLRPAQAQLLDWYAKYFVDYADGRLPAEA